MVIIALDSRSSFRPMQSGGYGSRLEAGTTKELCEDRHCVRSKAIQLFIAVKLDCFVATLLGRNWGLVMRPRQSKLSSPGLTGRSSTPRLLDLSQTSLEYWVARSSRATTAVFVSSIRVGLKAGTELAMTGSHALPPSHGWRVTPASRRARATACRYRETCW